MTAARDRSAPIRWLMSLTRIVGGFGAGLCLCVAAHAANPADWWIDITNDRAQNVKTMLARGADPNEISPDGQPAIMQAIREGSWEVYDVLVAHPKTVLNAININRETPLMYLAVVGETQRAKDLIRRGALVNRLGWTPLQYAASKGHLDTVKMLVAHKALVNSPGPDGTTALMMAAYDGNETVVQYLLDVGADVTMQTTQGYDAADWARMKNHNDLADKIDELKARVFAQRDARRVQSTPQQQEPEARDLRRDPVGRPDSRTSVESQPEGASSTSRYFDLERFEKE